MTHHPSAWGNTTLRRDDAAPRRRTNDSARGAVERTGYVAFVGLKGQPQMEQIGTVVAVLVKDHPVYQRVVFSHQDIDFLTRRNRLPSVFVARCLRIFGEAVVLESLRRTEPGWSEAVVFGVCRNVERGT